MSRIESIHARRVWDSRGLPTVEVSVELEGGVSRRAIAPAGASRGAREALDLRDGGERLAGLGVEKALGNVNQIIAPALKGLPINDQAALDEQLLLLDPSPQKSRLGGNATVATSLALINAAAAEAGNPLWKHLCDVYRRTPSIPLPEIQIFGGGAHAGRRLDIQDLMIMVPGASDFEEALEVTAEIRMAAGEILRRRGRLAGVADEGGWWPAFDSNEQALDTLVLAIEKAGEKPGERVVISLDIAASQLGRDGEYSLALEKRDLDRDGFIEVLGKWIDSYPIASIEDPLAEDDEEGLIAFTKRYADRVQIVGDDYLVCNATLVSRAAGLSACNAVLIKVNQAGTLTEAVRCVDAARDAGWRSIVSARSGESEDVAVSHLSVGLGCGQLKVGSFARSERMAKWNECLRIQDEIGRSSFAGGRPLANTWWGKTHQ